MIKEQREQPEKRDIQTPATVQGTKLVGYAIVYNSPSDLIKDKGKEFIEIVLPGAFDASLKTGKSAIEGRAISFVYRHDAMSTYGDTESNLKLSEDEKGIRFELDIPEYAVELKEAVGSGRIRDMSFEFYCLKDRWQDGTRFIESADLVHISAVSNGAYPEAGVELRQQSNNWKLKNLLLMKKIKLKAK